jgi:hypothetical protein
MKTERSRGELRDVLSLSGRIVNFYRAFNRQDWPRCYDYIDPRLRDGGKVEEGDYARTMGSFFAEYGPIQRVKILKLTIHPGEESKADGRDFAYIIISWEDKSNSFHHFRERWIKDRGKWFTRVVGLVPRTAES